MSGDSRVLDASLQDVAMLDIGLKDRPPEDPSDGPVSWARKVTGSKVGGMLSPESVLDEGFVEERVNLEFPDGEEGEPVITIGREVLDAMNGLWKQCMIVKVLGRTVPISILSRRLREMWKPRGAMYVMDLPRQFFMVRFEDEEEYLAALTGGPWKAFGSYLMVRGWSPEFNPMMDDIVTTPVWIRLSNILVTFYHKAILMGIARGLGKPIKVDLTTLNFERARFARVCVEVNLTKPLKGSVKINGERYFISYEGLSNICSGCGMYGHMIHSCPKNIVERAKAPIVSVPVDTQSDIPRASVNPTAEEGFTEVRRRHTRLGQPQSMAVVVTGGAREDLGRNLREITPNNIGNLTISNRFGGLEVEDNVPDRTGEIMQTVADKENQKILFQAKSGKSAAHAGNTRLGVTSEKGKSGSLDGPHDRRAHMNKGGINNGPKSKNNKPIRPTRGLVFGPMREENPLSSNGKRLRVERDTVGRSGGCFSTNECPKTGTSKLEITMKEAEADVPAILGNETQGKGVEMQSKPSEEGTAHDFA